MFQAPAGAGNSTQNETGETKPLLTSKMVSLPQRTGERSQTTELGRRKLASEINQARTQQTDNAMKVKAKWRRGFFGLTQKNEGK